MGQWMYDQGLRAYGNMPEKHRLERVVGPEVEAAATIICFMHESVERFKRTIAHLTEVARLQQESEGMGD
jgi:hypothetical protein